MTLLFFREKKKMAPEASPRMIGVTRVFLNSWLRFLCACAIELLNSCLLWLGSEDSANFWNVSVHLDLGLLVVLYVLTPSDLINSFIHQIFIVQDIYCYAVSIHVLVSRSCHNQVLQTR